MIQGKVKKKKGKEIRGESKVPFIRVVGLRCSPSDPPLDKHANQIINCQDGDKFFSNSKNSVVMPLSFPVLELSNFALTQV